MNNRWQREMERISQHADKATERRLREIFAKTLKQLEYQTNDLLDNDTIKFWQLFRMSALQNMQNQVGSVLYDNYEALMDESLSYLMLKQQLGWDEPLYQASQELNIDFNRVDLNQAYALANYKEEELAGLLSERLYSNTEQLANGVVDKLDTLLLTGTSSQKIAKELIPEINKVLQAELNSEYNKAIRIVRTENTRIQGRAKQASMEYSESLGIQMKKRWVSALDRRTRSTHQDLDGVTIPIDEKFVLNGHEADGPGDFGVAEEDIHCRCKAITIVEDYEPTTRRASVYDNEGNKTGTKLVSYTNYHEWAEEN